MIATVKDISKEDLIYAAGFFDGEGSIGIYAMGAPSARRTPSFTLVMNVTGTNQAAIMWWQMTFGGRVVCDYRSHSDVKCSDAYKWMCGSKKARAVLELLLPYLKIKKSEAEIGLQFQRHKDSYKAWSVRNSEGHNTKLPDNVVQFRRDLCEKLKAEKRAYRQGWWAS